MKRLFYVFMWVALVGILMSCAQKGTGTAVERKFTAKNENVQSDVSTTTQTNSIQESLANTQTATVVPVKKEIVVQTEKTVVKKTFKTFVSTIVKNSNSYDITLDGVILIKNVKIVNNKLVFPYTESNGKKYYFIWCNDKGLLGKIKNEIIKNKTKTATIKPKITKIVIKKLNKGALQGFAEVEFDKEFSIKSIPIFIGGKYGDNIGNPAVKIDGKYVPMVKILDREWKKVIQKRVLEKFYQD